MPADFDILQLSELAGCFALGLLIGPLLRFWARRTRKAATESGPVTIKVKGVSEPIVIPEHYNSAAIDKILRQLEIA